MSNGELSFKSSSSLRVTWSIPDFFRLATESDYSLRSPDFTFADGRYCLRLYETVDGWCEVCIGIELLNSIDTDPGSAVLYKVELKSRTGEIDMYQHEYNEDVFTFYRDDLVINRHVHVPDDTFTVLCSVRLREPGSAGSPESGGAQTLILPEYRLTGNLSSESFKLLHVTWKIPAFFQMTGESRCTLESPEFPFSHSLYRLRLLPYEDHVDIQLVNSTDSVPGRYVSYVVGLKSTTGEETDIECVDTSTQRYFYITRDRLHDMQHVRFPDGHLTVFCSMRLRESSSAGNPMSGGAESAGSTSPVPQAATRPKSVAVRTSDEEQHKEGLPGVSILLSDLKQLLQKMPDSDACLVVSGKEFRAHRMMLRARSKVFESIFGHETAERDSGRVVIDDLDSDSFGDFLEYLYTGVVGAGLSDDNAFGLYEAADKYDVPALKAECVAHMRRSLSVESFCDVLAVALRHSEEELLSAAVLFFKENMARIIVTAKWIQFATDNGASANELFIKAVVPPGQ